MESIYGQVAPFAVLESYPMPEEVSEGQFTTKSEDYLKEKETLKKIFFDSELLERIGLPMGFGGGSGGAAPTEEVAVEEVIE